MEKQEEELNEKNSIDDLFRRAIDFRHSEQFIRFFAFLARFQHYSRYNSMLVYLQNPEITFFGSKSYWRKHWGREIGRRAKPYLILSPGGPVSVVYDVMETTGREEPKEFLNRGVGRKWNEVQGSLPELKLWSLKKEIEAWGIQVYYKPLNFFKGGHITTILSGDLQICLRDDASPEENFSVLIHELAHLLLGHTGFEWLSKSKGSKPMGLPKRRLSKAVMELEAETVSFLICAKMGLQTASAEYLAGYISSPDVLSGFSYELVVRTADKLEKVFL